MKYLECEIGAAAPQGDMMLTCIEELPNHVSPMKIEDGKFILTHSETGHHHSVKFDPAMEYYSNDNDPFIAYLVVNNSSYEPHVEHERNFDTHETIALKAPVDKTKTRRVYEIKRQIQHTPDRLKQKVID